MGEPRKKDAARWNRLEGLVTKPDGTMLATYQTRLWRFLFSDGRTVDVTAIWDDSELREAVREAVGAEKIEGIALVEDQGRLV